MFTDPAIFSILLAAGIALVAVGRWVGNVDTAMRQRDRDSGSETAEFMELSLNAIKESNKKQNAITVVSALGVIGMMWAFMHVEHESDHVTMQEEISSVYETLEEGLQRTETNLSEIELQVSSNAND